MTAGIVSEIVMPTEGRGEDPGLRIGARDLPVETWR